MSISRDAFTTLFHLLTSTFRLKGTPDELKTVCGAYYTIFAPISEARVRTAVTAYLREGKFFPKPAELLARLPAATTEGEVQFVRCGEDRGGHPQYRRVIMNWPLLTTHQVAEYRAAERDGWERQACKCADCRKVGVDHKPIRYVPEFTDDGLCNKGKDPTTGHLLYLGHWAHGQELVRWYVARDEFYAKFRAWAAGLRVAGTAPRGQGWTSTEALAHHAAGMNRPLTPPVPLPPKPSPARGAQTGMIHARTQGHVGGKRIHHKSSDRRRHGKR